MNKNTPNITAKELQFVAKVVHALWTGEKNTRPVLRKVKIDLPPQEEKPNSTRIEPSRNKASISLLELEAEALELELELLSF